MDKLSLHPLCRQAIALFAGALLVFASPHLSARAAAPTFGVPAGFTPIFDGKDTKGWHWSKTNHHGTDADAAVRNGELVLKQHPFGQGGLLLTDKRYRNYEFYIEVKEPWGCNSGIFLRSTEGGSAYQVELDQAGGNGNLLGELIHLSKGAPATDLKKVWRDGDWNTFRIRMTGDSPHLQLWVNDALMWDVQEPDNDSLAGETDGRIGLQLHWSAMYQPSLAGISLTPNWKPDTAINFRNIAIKELP